MFGVKIINNCDDITIIIVFDKDCNFVAAFKKWV